MAGGATKLVCLFGLLVVSLWAQQQQQPHNLPDTPQPKPGAQQTQFPEDAPPAPKNDHPAGNPSETPAPTAAAPAPRNTPQPGMASSRDDLYKVSISVNFVQIPVTVKDKSGHLVSGLTPNDFTVLEDGTPQQLKFFTSDPFPLSAAIVLDTDLPSTTMKKVNESLPALISAF